MKKILILVVVLAAGAWLGKNLVGKFAVTSVAKAITGLAVDIGSMDIGVVKTRVGIKRLIVRNPAGFADPVMISIPEIYVDYDLPAFLQGKAHIEEMRLDLAELAVIKNQDGQVNLQALNVVKKSQGKPAPPNEEQKAEQMPFVVDQLRLRIGKVVYKDYTGGGEPRTQEFAVDIDRTYQRITDPLAFGSLVVSEALVRTTLAKMPGASELGGITSNLQQAYSGAVGAAVTDAVRQVEGLGQGVAGSAGQAVKETTDALKKLLPTGN
jgi:hypothetical protein